VRIFKHVNYERLFCEGDALAKSVGAAAFLPPNDLLWFAISRSWLAMSRDNRHVSSWQSSRSCVTIDTFVRDNCHLVSWQLSPWLNEAWRCSLTLLVDYIFFIGHFFYFHAIPFMGVQPIYIWMTIMRLLELTTREGGEMLRSMEWLQKIAERPMKWHFQASENRAQLKYFVFRLFSDWAWKKELRYRNSLIFSVDQLGLEPRTSRLWVC